MSDLRLTIGMAVVNDYRGLRYTLTELQVTHGHMLPWLEFVVVHNEPESRDGEKCRRFVEHKVWNAKFVPFASPKGTSAPRDAIFRHATAPAVAVIDPHITFGPRAVQNLVNFFNANPKTPDLFHGPLMQDRPVHRPHVSHPTPRILATHMRPVWRDKMLGVWGKAWVCTRCRAVVDVTRESGEGLVYRTMDGETVDRCACGLVYPTVAFSGHEAGLESGGLREPLTTDPPFRIPAHGLGFFACRRESWLGFPEGLRGFGGEEVCLHRLFERHGRSTWCLPGVRWTHEFRDPDDDPGYPNVLNDRLRNYIIWHRATGDDPQPAVEHFQTFLPPIQIVAAFQDGAAVPVQPAPRPNLADAAYRQACATPSDINEHLPLLRGLAAECETVVELGVRSGVSTRALIAGRPKWIVSVDIERTQAVDALRDLAKAAGVVWEFVRNSSLTVEPCACDMLFVDTLHTAEQLRGELARHAAQARRYIVLHDTATFGVDGERGGYGLLKALADFLKAHRDEWEIQEHHQRNNGLTVLRRTPREPADDIRGLSRILDSLNCCDGVKATVALWFGAKA